MAYKNKEISNPQTGQSIKFLQTAKDTGGHLLEMETTYEGHSKEPPEHYHPYQEENFEIISGELSLKVNGQKKILKAGEQLHIPKNTVHAMWNDSENKTVINWRVFPAMDTEYLLELGMGLANDGKLNKKGRPNILQLALLANKYADVFRLTKPSFIIQQILFTILSPFAYLAGYRASYKKYID